MINYIRTNRDGQKTARPVKNRKEYFALRNAATNVRNFEKARAGDQKAKAKLLQFNYNALLPNGVLKNCKHAASTFALDIDCGKEAACREIAQRILERKEQIALLELSVSSGWGLHAVCRRELGRTILENQVRVAAIAETELDTNAHDYPRVMYTGPATEDTLLYLDDAIFEEPLSLEESAAEYQRLKEREKSGREEVPAGAKRANKHFRCGEDQGDRSREDQGEDQGDRSRDVADLSANHGPVPIDPPCFKGRPYAEIIDEWWKRNGGVPQEGERNVKLYRLAVNLRAICDNNKALLLQVMPRLGLDEEELQNIVESACKETPKGISKPMREIIGGGDSSTALGMTNVTEEDLAHMLWLWGEQIEALFDAFPLIRDICKGLKKNQYPAALFVAGGLLMTLMTRCTYRFYHRRDELRRLNNCTLIIGDPASGKSFATRLYKLLTAPIVAADEVGREAINAYREQMRSKGANKEKPKKPKVVYRVHPARTSNAQFIQDMVNSVEEVDGQPMQLHMLTFDTELDNTLSVQRGGSWIDKQSLELKAFHNEEDGQAYSNNDSILQNFFVTWNFIYTGTPMALKKKVNEQNFGSGMATRLTCIPLPATNFEMMEEDAEVIDLEGNRHLTEWAERLDRMKGELSVKKIVHELYEWTARRMADAKDNDSKADEMLLKRCAYHGLNFSAPFIVMRHWDQLHQDGQYWCGEFETDDVDWRLAELIVNIQYACQRHYFGAMAEAYFDNKLKDASVNVRRQPKTIESFNRLPELFSQDDVMRCFNLNGYNVVRAKMSRLLKDGLVEKVSDGRNSDSTMSVYRKTGKRMQ